MLRIRYAKAGQVLRYAMRDETNDFLHLTPGDNIAMIVPPISNSCVGLLLSGSGMAIPSGSDLGDIIQERRAQRIAAGNVIGSSPFNSISAGRRSYHSATGYSNAKVNEKKSILGHIRAYVGGRSNAYSTMDQMAGMAEFFTPELKAELVKVYPGALFGLEQHFVKNITIGTDSIVVSSRLVGWGHILTVLTRCNIFLVFGDMPNRIS
jgi:hypothetical protein